MNTESVRNLDIATGTRLPFGWGVGRNQNMNTFPTYKRILQALLLRLDPDWSKDEYLSWREDWRSTYKALSEASRELKSYRSVNRLKGEVSLTKLGQEPDEVLADLHNFRVAEVLELRLQANVMLQIRKVSKALANAANRKYELRSNT